MKIGIFQDVHANLPAFEKAIQFFRENECAKIYHVGDLIGIGPYPKEVFHQAVAIEKMVFIMGNHDYWFGHGLPKPQPTWMSDEEVEHQEWTHLQIGEDYRKIVQSWKFIEEVKWDTDRTITFQHYGYDEKLNWFKPHILHPKPSDLDQMYESCKSDMVFYGHNHLSSDLQGHCRYINLGSAGCWDRAEVRLGILEITGEKLKLEKYSIPYNDDGLMEAFEDRQVPAREFITSNFIRRRKK